MTAGESVPTEADRLEVVLLPDGRVARHGLAPDPDAAWEVLGSICESGVIMGFVRVELAGASWAAFIPEARLTRTRSRPRVRLRRQSSPGQHPPMGWALFS